MNPRHIWLTVGDMTEQQTSSPHRVVIAGGGVAGLEALIGLHRLAGDRVSTTLLAPTSEYLVRALSVQDPFARPTPRRYALQRICADHDAEFVQDGLATVDPERNRLTTAQGTEMGFDSLLVAIGARAEEAYPGAGTFRGLQDAEAMHGLLQDVEGGYTKRIAFVVPPGVTWSLPLYELALMTAERAYSLNLDVQLTIVTPEGEPLAIFGRSASESVDKILADAGITVVPNAHVRQVDHGEVIASPGDVVVRADRVVALPRLVGPGVRGLRADAHGFLPVDDLGRVTGTDDVFAAGDGTTFAIKQGGIAAQQADAVARALAGRAGAEVTAQPFRPVLRAKLLTGSQAKYLRQAVSGGTGDSASTLSDHTLWWPPTKVAAPYLSPYLEQLDTGTGAPSSPSGPPAPSPDARAGHGEGDPSGGIELIGR
jgi:sulfide:quinone oxidoreductase